MSYKPYGDDLTTVYFDYVNGKCISHAEGFLLEETRIIDEVKLFFDATKEIYNNVRIVFVMTKQTKALLFIVFDSIVKKMYID